MTTVSIRDRYRGALLGLAAGDAVGTTLEFKRPGSFTPITDMVGGGPFNLKSGQWTDDTSMALCLAESLVENRGFAPADQMARYVRWWREGYLSSTGHCFDIGNTVREALHRFEKSGEPYSGSTHSRSAGNGSIMRLAPVPLFFAQHPQTAIDMAGQSSRTTHGATAAIDGCRYLGALIIGALKGEPKEVLLSARYSPLTGYWEQHPLVAEIDEIAAGSFKKSRPPEPNQTDQTTQVVEATLSAFFPSQTHQKVIKGSGYVVESLEAALWAFYHSQTFAEGCLLAVNLGDDADTTGAVYGQVAGAFYGESGIPKEWREKLAYRELIEALAEQLLTLAASGQND